MKGFSFFSEEENCWLIFFSFFSSIYQDCRSPLTARKLKLRSFSLCVVMWAKSVLWVFIYTPRNKESYFRGLNVYFGTASDLFVTATDLK